MTLCFLRSNAHRLRNVSSIYFSLSSPSYMTKLNYLAHYVLAEETPSIPCLTVGWRKKVRLIYKSCQIQLTPIESVIDIDKKRFSSWTNVFISVTGGIKKGIKTVLIDNEETAIKIYRNYILMRLLKMVYLIHLPFQDDFLCLSSDNSIMEDCWQCDPFKDYDVIANANEPEMGYVSSSAIRST